MRSKRYGSDELDKMAQYNLQADYIDNVYDLQKLALFKSLSSEVQSIAEEQCGALESCSGKALIEWIATKYADAVTIPFFNSPHFCYEGDEHDETINNHWIKKFRNYEPYDPEHLVAIQLKEHVNASQIVKDDEHDSVSFDTQCNSVRFLCPSYWTDVPLEFVVSIIVENYSFNTSDIIDASVEG